MTTPLPPAPVWPDQIYLLQTGDPVQGGPDGIANVATKQLDLRTQLLRTGQQLQTAQITNLTNNLTALTQTVAASQAEVLANVVEALTGGAGIYNEQFESRWTLIDTGNGTSPLALTAAVVPVAGDDSLDVASTAKLLLGETYVLFNGAGYRQEVTVAQILGPNRLRISPALTGAVPFPAWLGRTDWDVATPRIATASVGGIYRSRLIDLGPVGPQPKALLIRHTGVGALDVEWQSQGSLEFIDAPWWRKRSISVFDAPSASASGATETQYLLPTSGPTRLRITAVSGPVTVHWIATQPTPAMAEGIYNPSPRPRLISPAQGEAALGPQPVLQIAAYTPPPGLTVAGVVYEVAKVADNAIIHTSAPQPVGAAYTLPDNLVLQDTAYRFTARIKPASSGLGEPSKPILGRTIPDFRVIVPPTILTPLAGSVDLNTQISLTPFGVQRGADTCTAVQIQVVEAGDWDAAWDRVTAPGVAVYLHEAGVRMGRSYAVRARYQGQDLGWSRWSATRQIVIPTELWITTPGAQAWRAPAVRAEYEILVLGGGASGFSSRTGSATTLAITQDWGKPGAGGASGVIQRALRVVEAGQILQVRVGRGGNPVPGIIVTDDLDPGLGQGVYQGSQNGESSQVDTLIALGGGNGWPYNVMSVNGLRSYVNGILNVNPMDDRGGPSHFPLTTSGGGILGGDGHVDGGGWNGAASYNVFNYYSRYGVRIPTPALSGPPLPPSGAVTALYGGPGAGGIEAPTGSVQLAEKPSANGGAGGKGYGAGGGGAARPAPGEPATLGGRGAQGVVIIRFIREVA